MKKYELTENTIVYLGITLYQIKALVSFGTVKAGELGGYIEKEENLTHDGNAWVYGNAMVYDNASVYGNAWVYGEAMVCGNAEVYGNAWVYGNARVYGNAEVYGEADVLKSTHLLQVGAIGSRNGFITFFRTKNNSIQVSCGCFLGTIEEFAAAVTKKHSGTKHEKTYLAAIELAKLQIELDTPGIKEG